MGLQKLILSTIDLLKKILLKEKKIIGCIFMIMYSILGYSADVDQTKKSLSFQEGSGLWRNRYNYSYEIEVLRLPNERVNHYLGYRTEIYGEKQAGKVERIDVQSIMTGVPSGVQMPIQGYRMVIDPGSKLSFLRAAFEGDNVSGTFRGREGSSSEIDRGNLEIERRLIIEPWVEDGEWNINYNNPVNKTVSQIFRIRTIVSITVGDIDFGEVVFHQSGGTVTKSASIKLEGGTANKSIDLSFPSGSRTDTLELTRIGSDDRIVVEVEITPNLPNLDSSGGGETYLVAKIDTSQEVESGYYTGNIEVTVEYN